jgi:Ca-activated chloride channel family protein
MVGIYGGKVMSNFTRNPQPAHFSRVVILVLVQFLLCASTIAQERVPAEPSSQPAGSNEITVTFTVTDKKNQPASGLSQNNFSITDGKVSPALTSFTNQESPTSIAIVFDRSSSARNVALTLQSLANFVQLSHSSNEYFVIGFNDDSYLLLDGSRDVKTTVAALNKILSMPLKAHTSLFDACYLGLEKLKHGTYSKRMMLLVSDGDDTYSRARQDDVRDLLQETNIIVYALYSGPFPSTPSVNQVSITPPGLKVLEKLAALSGGLAFYPTKPTEVLENMEQVAAELRSQYTISFRPTKVLTGGQCLSFKIKVAGSTNEAPQLKSLKVRSREKYCLAVDNH